MAQNYGNSRCELGKQGIVHLKQAYQQLKRSTKCAGALLLRHVYVRDSLKRLVNVTNWRSLPYKYKKLNKKATD